jgi:Zn-dependent oligopeptidase
VTKATGVSEASKNNNWPILERLLVLRDEESKLLGFDNYAAMSLSNKMAGEVAKVDELADMLRKVNNT